MNSPALTNNTLLIASKNPGKIREFQKILGELGLILKTGADIDFPDVEETGATFQENAELKARSAAEHTSLSVVADDSGFMVECMNDWPGIRSSRVVDEMGGDKNLFPHIDRHAREAGNPNASFYCALALCHPDGSVEHFASQVKGAFVFPPRGDKGFGYDPVFVPNGHTQTFAEMNPEDKNAISHRGQAIKKLYERLRQK